MTGFVLVGRRIRVSALVARAVLASGIAAAAALAPAGTARAADVVAPISESNTALLGRAADAAARQLVARVPLTPGARVGLRPETTGELDQDMREALLRALTARRIACVLLEPAATGAPAEADTAAAPTGPGQGASTVPPGMGSGTDLAALAQQAADAQRNFQQLQDERAAQAARADSIARTGQAEPERTMPDDAPTTALAVHGNLPVLTWRVQEARIDYVRSFRGGLFGAHRVERRARADLALRLMPAGSDAIAWSASADTTIGDVVLKSELASLEDRTRPETRPQLPSSSFKKILEPALVVILVAGLVSLFYQNRP